MSNRYEAYDEYHREACRGSFDDVMDMPLFGDDDTPPEPDDLPPPMGERIDVADPAPIELDFINAASLADISPPPRRWAVPDLIPFADVTMVSGDGATGKSLLALQLAEATASGGKWLGFTLERGKAIYVSAEDELDELHRRLAAISQHIGGLSDLLLVPLAGRDAILAAPAGRDGLLAATPLFNALERLIKQHSPSLLALDTLADLFGGDEIKKVHARQFIGMLRGLALKYEVTIVLLSHPSLSGMQSGSGTSGNTAWNNSVRSRLYFERLKNVDGSEDDADLRALTKKKANRAATGGKIVVRYVEGRFVCEDMAKQSSNHEREVERLFLALLAKFEREGRNVSHQPSKTYAPTVFADHPDGAAIKSQIFAKAMNKLFSSGRIRIEESGPPSRRRQRIVMVNLADLSASDFGSGE